MPQCTPIHYDNKKKFGFVFFLKKKQCNLRGSAACSFLAMAMFQMEATLRTWVLALGE
jgi:hypothetical protein